MFCIYIKIYKNGGCPGRLAKSHLRLFVGMAREVAIYDSLHRAERRYNYNRVSLVNDVNVSKTKVCFFEIALWR